ncbi:hypothetical protein RRG08_057327 [Elysia crispata]|uniref:Uncharacterized protein n=1 Tax=Elysia crispata TaxID=231223 RepID=A0AAE0Y4T5_9GAST|nr:hypothetical protein RRG08_057327 [Elysia crispata]
MARGDENNYIQCYVLHNTDGQPWWPPYLGAHVLRVLLYRRPRMGCCRATPMVSCPEEIRSTLPASPTSSCMKPMPQQCQFFNEKLTEIRYLQNFAATPAEIV